MRNIFSFTPIRHMSKEKKHTTLIATTPSIQQPNEQTQISHGPMGQIFHGPMGCASVHPHGSHETYKPYYPHVEHEHGHSKRTKHERIHMNNTLQHHYAFNDLGSVPYVYFPYIKKNKT